MVDREPNMQDVYAILLGLQGNMSAMRTDLDNKLQNLNITVVDIGQKMDNLNSRVGDCEQRMSRVEDNTKGELDNVTRKLNDMSTNMSQRLSHMENAAGAAAQHVISSVVIKNLPEEQVETPEMLTLAVTTLFNSLDPGEFTISSSYRVGDPGRRSRTIIIEMSSIKR